MFGLHFSLDLFLLDLNLLLPLQLPPALLSNALLEENLLLPFLLQLFVQLQCLPHLLRLAHCSLDGSPSRPLSGPLELFLFDFCSGRTCHELFTLLPDL